VYQVEIAPGVPELVVRGDIKGTHSRGYNRATLFLGGFKYGNLILQVGEVSDETVKYGYGFCAIRAIE
jgi:hypothetical protein